MNTKLTQILAVIMCVASPVFLISAPLVGAFLPGLQAAFIVSGALMLVLGSGFYAVTEWVASLPRANDIQSLNKRINELLDENDRLKDRLNKAIGSDKSKDKDIVGHDFDAMKARAKRMQAEFDAARELRIAKNES